MNALEQAISNIEAQLPEMCSTSDLMRIGLVNSHQAARALRKKNKGPSYFQLGKRILYPKKAVIEYFEKSANPCAEQVCI